MSEKEQEKDWELSEDYYKNPEQGRELSLENFITEDDETDKGLNVDHNTDELLKKTAADVHTVLELAQKGKSIEEIAALTGLDKQYVYNIQVCAQGFREDDEIAVAHLVLG